MDIAVCDNDKAVRDDISRLIRRECPEADIAAFASGEELLRAEKDFSIYFLDVKGVDGLQIAQKLRDRQARLGRAKSILIFITGYKEYMGAAFDVQAFHYLLKPLDEQKFRQVLARACQEAQTGAAQAQIFLLVKVGERQQKIAAKDILYIESANKKVIVHTPTAAYEVYGKMEAFAAALGDSFYRCHRCYLVNFAKISAYTPDTIQLTNGAQLILARRKYSGFVQAYLRYARDGGVVNV